MVHKSLNILKFDQLNREWLDFIANCRSGKVHNFDIVEGPTADDEIWDHVRDYLSGRLTQEIFYDACQVQTQNPPNEFSYLARIGHDQID